MQMPEALKRDNLPQTLLALLPLLLFFPVAYIYSGVFFFFLALFFSGNFRNRWDTIKSNPLFVPIVIVSVVTLANALVFGKQSDIFWKSLGHYQIYLFLLLFLSVGAGKWQAWARNMFFIGAVYGSSVFFMTWFNWLPQVQPFKSYWYSQGKSIILCILIAIAAAWMLYDLLSRPGGRMRWLRWAGLIFVSSAVVFAARSRTAHLIFILLLLGVILTRVKMTWRNILIGLALVSILAGLAWHFSGAWRERAVETIKDAQSYSQGNSATSTGIRLDLYATTYEIFIEKPVFGHGIGTWLPTFRQRSVGRPANEMLTPHNEYLLFAAEAGVIGLGALLFVWLWQLVIAFRFGGYYGAILGMLGVSMIVAGMFNAILRDGVYAMPFMILLSIPLAGMESVRRLSR